MRTLELYFHDLTPNAQMKVLALYGMQHEDEGNFEISSLVVLECAEESVES